jgi:hypothetical protein
LIRVPSPGNNRDRGETVVPQNVEDRLYGVAFSNRFTL